MIQILKTGNEPLHFSGKATEKTIGRFWAWSSSDLLSNTLRGGFGEFVVASALEIDLQQTRTDWLAYDLQYGVHRIEVKSAAYLQAWENKAPSKISFGIGPSREWSAETNLFADEAKRHADVYVFCLLNCLDRTKVDPLDMNQWEFYVLHTNVLNERCPNQKTISLSSLKKLAPIETNYDVLKKTVDQVLAAGT